MEGNLAMRLRSFLVGMFTLVLFLAGCSGSEPAIVMTQSGCSAAHFRLAPDREPLITVENQADTAMVLTIPVMNRWIAVEPSAQAEFELPRYIMGSFDYFCLEEAEHTRISGGNPFLCSMEPDEVAPVALSQGIFEIEPHNRIEEISSR